MRPSEPIAVIGVSAIMPNAPTAASFWSNITGGRYCVTDVPADRWDSSLYFDPDPAAPDKTYSRIGGWVREFPWDPMGWKLPLPPSVAKHLDEGQKWSLSAARSALLDAGWPTWEVDSDRVAVIIGNALGGEKHDYTNLRAMYPQFERDLADSGAFAELPNAVRERIATEVRDRYLARLPEITEDTMPGELANVLAGRVAAQFNLRGPNFTTDAACASALAALNSAVDGLRAGAYDVAIAGGLDRNMGPGGYIRFCKIGALSATGSRPFDAAADGFVMGEGTALFVLRRLRDAQAAGDRIYALIRGIGGSSDGRGKGITAPNPVGQRLAIERAWADAGLDRGTVGMIEAHGTSTRVGDATELATLAQVFDGLPAASVALGSVKSNIGHLKAAAGAAGLFKAVMSLSERTLAPSLNFRDPNPSVDWSTSPFAVTTELQPWPERTDGVPRRAGVSSFGFGGTNFHVVLEEYVPDRNFNDDSPAEVEVGLPSAGIDTTAAVATDRKSPLRGAVVLGAPDLKSLATQLEVLQQGALRGETPPRRAPAAALASAPHRIAIDFADAADLAAKSAKALQALAANTPAAWRMLRAQGVYLGGGAAGKVAFLYTGQGSQYVNMLADLRATEPIVAEVFAQADKIMTPLIGRPLSDFVFGDTSDPEDLDRLTEQLLQTEITQPAVLTTDEALSRLLAGYDIHPDMVMGHSLGEYGALVAAGCLSFSGALEAVSARGREMAGVSAEDNGAMVAVMGPLAKITSIVEAVDGYVVVANINSPGQAVIGGATVAVGLAATACQEAGMTAIPIPVSHAFHTEIVEPAAAPLQVQLRRLEVLPPSLPIVANATGEFYPQDATVDTMIDILGRQVASPVQFVAGLHSLYDAGARVFVEVGPKRALHGFAEDVLGSIHDDVTAVFTNHPKSGDLASFNQALCALWAAGVGFPPEAGDAAGSAGAAGAASAPGAPDEAQVVATVVGVVTEMTGYPAELLDLDLDMEADLGVDTVKQAEVFAGVRERFGIAREGDLKLRDFPTLRHVVDWVIQSVGTSQTVTAAPSTAAPSTAAPSAVAAAPRASAATVSVPVSSTANRVVDLPAAPAGQTEGASAALPVSSDRLAQVGQLFAEALQSGLALLGESSLDRATAPNRAAPADLSIDQEAVVITGAALGLPGTDSVFADDNLEAILSGRNLISAIPPEFRDRMADMRITRLVKSAGEPTFDTIEDAAGVIKLAGRAAPFDVVEEFGVAAERDKALDAATRLAIGAGFDALRDAGIPLVMRYKRTTIGTELPDRWGLPESMRDDTGVVFASAFPGLDAFTAEIEAYARDRARREQLQALESVRAAQPSSVPELDSEIDRLRLELSEDRFEFDRRFIFKILSMGHSQFAELIGARGPNTAVNAACASATQALAVAEDWIRTGRARRVIVISADDSTSPSLLPWIGSGFLASGAAAIDESVADVATPFDRRRHGMIVGMGAGAFVVEAAASAAERGLQPICEVMASTIANSAFHGTRLDVDHVAQVMERLVVRAERAGVERQEIAASGVFVSHETYTPARGGSAAAEVNALRTVFGRAAEDLVITNTKGFTGHAMGAGVEDVVAIKSLETGLVPPVANYREHDPELGQLNLSQGGGYPVKFAIRLAAGFGSQIAMSLLRWTPIPDGLRRAPKELGYEYRIVDRAVWRRWLEAAAGNADPRLEVDHRRLRIVDTRSSARVATNPGSVTARVDEGVEGSAVGSVAGVEATVLAVVSELTGYPVELLDLGADMEADLGVDTVKQAEVFATVREKFDIARDDELQLRDFPTLQHVIDWMSSRVSVGNSLTGDVDRPAAPIAGSVTARVDEGVEGSAVGSVAGVEATVLAVVSELTGYPVELLDLGADMEADLGVDTVKQAEVFATVREKFDIARDDELQLRDFPTLQHVIDWMSSRVSVGNALTGELQPPVGGAGVGPRIPTSTQQVPRRVPVPVLRPELSECEPTGVSLGAGDHIVIGTDQSGVADELAATLRDRGCDVTLFAPEPESVLPVEPVTGIFWLPALDEDGDLPDLESWRSALGRRLHSLYALVRHTVDQAPFLVTGTRLGGLHGYGQEPASNALGGGVTGFAKSYHREQPLTTVKAIDFGPAAADTVAAALCEEALRGPGQVEIGRYSDQRFGIGLAEQPLTEELHTSLHPDSVFVVTGASGAIAAAVAADLAEVAGGGTFYLLARTELPDAGDPDVATLRSDPAGLRDVVIERLTETGARVTPVEVAAVVAAVERGANARAGVDAVVAAGGVAIYRRTDVADPVAVEEVISEIRAAHQRVDVLIHAAGIEVSKDLTRKDEQEFANVVSVKADGWFNLLAATTELEVGVAIAFTSIAGRFGNAGQTDYAAGNDLICKSVSELRGTRPGTRAVALDWTAWGGIGMATRGSIPQVMAAAGVELLDPGCGIDFLRREILHGTQGGEVVVAGELGLMAAGSDPTGGLRPQPADGRFGPMIDTLDQLDPDLGLVATVTLDPREQPFLTDHRIDGTAVLPGVMGIEAMIAAAMAMAPGWHPVAIEEVDFRAPVKFYRDEPRTLTVTAAGAPLGDDLVFSCVLSASRVLPGRAEPQSVDHFTGRVRLSRSRLPDVEFGELLAADQIVSAEDVYRFYFHGPAYQVVNSAWRTSTGVAAQMAADLPRHHDGDNGTVTRPRLIELCFQTAGLVEAGRDGRLALPSHVDRVEFITSNSVAESECRCEVLEGADGFDVTVVDAAGTTVVRVLGYRTIGVSDDLDPLVRGPLQEVLVGGLA